MDRSRPTLLLVNGLPASGKSTLARLVAESRPGSLVLDIDVVRSMLGGSAADPIAAGEPARVLALAMARAHLSRELDVIVPQYLGRDDLVVRMAAVAADTGARFAEAVLDVSVEVVTTRFARRSEEGRAVEHRDAAALLASAGGRAELDRMQERLVRLVAARPGTVRIAADRAPRDAAGELAALLANDAGSAPSGAPEA